jgi:gas vesicle protein
MPSKKISFMGGALIGAALSIAAGLFMQSKKGKKLRSDIKEKTAEFYAYLAPKLKNMKQIGEKEFSEFIEAAAKDYAEVKKITSEEIKILITDAKSTWAHLKKHAS